MRCSAWFLALAAIGATIGCGGSETPPATSATATGGASSPSPAPADPVGRVAFEFLEAVRLGQGENAAEKLLTPLALKSIQERDLCIAPPGSPTARFKINHVEMMPTGDRAVVHTVWTDVDADGKSYDESIYWALRQCDGAWRIHGMAPEINPGEAPTPIDFENLDALVEQQPAPPAVPSDRLAAPADAQPAEAVARDPFNQPAQR